MGKKYRIDAFKYPYCGYSEVSKHTNWFIIAVFYFAVYSIKYDGVDIYKRR